MKLHRQWIRSLLMVLFLACAPSAPSDAAATSAAQLDAEKLALCNLRQVTQNGGGPRFAPTGEGILFERRVEDQRGYSRPQIWMIRRGNEELVLRDAYNPAWSPDGQRLAYCTSDYEGPSTRLLHGLGIYDLSSGETYQLFGVSQTACRADLYWTNQGDALYVLRNLYYLDDLTSRSLREEEYCDPKVEKSLLRKNCDLEGWEEANLVLGRHREVEFWVDDGALWVGNREDWFRKVLHSESPRPWPDSLAVSHDAAKLAFSSRGSIWMADLCPDPDLPLRTFEVDLGRKDLLAALRSESFAGKVNGWLDLGTLVAEVRSPKINPLNDKVVGPGHEVKGRVRMLKLLDGDMTVTTFEERTPLQAGDILADPKLYRGDSRIFEWRDAWAALSRPGTLPERQEKASSAAHLVEGSDWSVLAGKWSGSTSSKESAEEEEDKQGDAFDLRAALRGPEEEIELALRPKEAWSDTGVVGSVYYGGSNCLAQLTLKSIGENSLELEAVLLRGSTHRCRKTSKVLVETRDLPDALTWTLVGSGGQSEALTASLTRLED